jgi:hypothetical protein
LQYGGIQESLKKKQPFQKGSKNGIISRSILTSEGKNKNKNMSDILKHQYRDHENELLRVKRLTYLAETAVADPEQSAEVKQQEKHTEELAEFFKMSPDAAQQSRTEAGEQRDDAIKELFDGFKGKYRPVGWLKSFKWEESGRHGNADKEAISESVNDIAEGRVKKLVDDINGLQERNYYLNTSIDRHTELTLTLLNEKSVVLGEFKEALDQKLQEEKGQVERVNNAITALKEARTGVFRRFKGVGVPKMKEINDRIKKYTQLGEAVTTLTSENNAELIEKKKEEEATRDKENIITEMLLERAPELASELDEALMQATLNNNAEIFNDFLDNNSDRLNITEVERQAVLQMLKTFFIDNKIATDYYLNQQREIGVLNRKEDDLKTRAERLKTNQRVHNVELQSAPSTYHKFRIIGRKNNSKKIFLKSGEDVAIIDLSKTRNPSMTLIKDGGTPESYKLSVATLDPGEEVNLTAIQFSAEKIDLSPSTTS